ncbi:GntR family transcriptional regulator [Micromonospora sp. NPDC007230]|uniref:GntR family transcriptional regulator n=1 Tax=Micromonospora sp. NPDC007230 TaxID=3364237 RepID=UPI0036A6293E
MTRSEPRASGGYFAYVELKRRILHLEFEPGQRLYEPALAESLEVSRTPLREAIRRLIAENLLTQQPTGGVVVPALDPREIAELYDVRAALEALMAREACRKVTDDDVRQLTGIVERNAALVNFADEAMTTGKSLHDAIARIANNSWASRLHDQVSDHMVRYRHLTNSTQQRREAALTEHRAILEAVTGDDPEHAGQTAYAHVIAARDQALQAIGTRLDG